MTPIEAGEEILRCINLIDTMNTENNDKMSEIDKEICDIQHFIELTPLDIQRGYKLAKQLQDALQERRRLKDNYEMLRILYGQVVLSGACKSFVTTLTSHLAGAKRRNEELQRRIYSPRSQAFQPESPPVEQVVDG